MHRPKATGAGCLVADRLESARDLTDDVCEPLTVLLGPLESADRLSAAAAKPGDACGLFEDRAAVPPRGDEERVDAALFDDAVCLGGRPGAGEEFADVAEPRGLAVDEIFALAVTVDPPRDLDGVALHRQCAARVVEAERHLGHVEWLAGGGPGEDDVGHLLAAEAPDRLLAKHPLDGVDDV